MAGFFQFGGRIGRLAYFGRIMALTLVVVLAIGVAFYVALATGRGTTFDVRGLPPVVPVLVTAIMIPAAWASLALMVRRLRDIGLPPLPVIGLFAAFVFFDHVALANLFRTMGWPTVGGGSLLGLAIQTAAGLALLLVPGDALSDPQDAGTTGFDGPAAPAPGPRLDRRHPRREFGLRGR
ncbi:DUF805 domain-containing protein [Phreatobacter sp. AB_2022a]|uniref:DUF805 domain-containing protein n=1 Tax=Phreatobacter sp. AB_2022a TaxID=3003134 RepID=UPI002286ED82|nr:DUF805 domain-containing protein [Phreatobacter sp. AB_2022a]MCZ0732738.1 DUF805 domain-containing protein [Phreatobacter sp. AB_2022a]